MKFHALLKDLPPIPQHFLDRAKEIAVDGTKNELVVASRSPEYYARILSKGDQQYQSSRTYRYDIGEDFFQWIKENIVSEFRETSVSILRHRSPSFGPHSDTVTFFRLIYPISTGGNNCYTTWWQEKGKSIYPPIGHVVTDYSTLDEIDRVKMEPNNWYIIDTRPLHSVENVTSDRIAIHVSLRSCNLVKERNPEISQWMDDEIYDVQVS